jgi:menaquinone-dependent protoporphyrinogen oxidase
LVVYDTVEGQSAKIAEHVAGVARDAGFEAVVTDAKQLSDNAMPGCERAIVVASVHMGRHARGVRAFVREQRDWLAARPSAFFSVSLSAASSRDKSQRDAQEMMDEFLATCGWKPNLAVTVAGALPYSKYGFLKRHILRAKSAGEAGPTDTSRDYEYTDWQALARQVNAFLGDVAKEAPQSHSLDPVPREIPPRAGKSFRRSEKLLRDFDKTARLVRRFLMDRYGEAEADALHRAAREKYKAIIPQIIWVKGPRALVMNAFLCGTAQEIAVYQAVKERGGTAAEAWGICHEANRLSMKEFPKWKRWLLKRFMFSRLVRRIARSREERHALVQAGDFEVRYVTGDGSDFDLGVDYLRCGNLELAKKLGVEEFAPYVCMSDIVLSDALGWGLTRTQTLADGCSHCDFRFKKDAETQISSKTPEVQQTIERIRKAEES